MRNDAVRQYLERFPRFEVKPGLPRIRALLEALGNPHRAFPSVHIGGTNGKGSVVAMLDSILRAAGFRIGRFTSPAVLDFRDRIVLDGDWISEAELGASVSRLIPITAQLEETPSQFEVMTALMFDFFARSEVELGLIEVGLGGRFDATNLVLPDLAILTNVSLDHCALLGDTVEKIAWEKAGIAKSDVPLLVGDLQPSVLEVVAAECAAVGAELHTTDDLTLHRRPRGWNGHDIDVAWERKQRRFELGLLGSPQIRNLGVVLRAVTLLRECGYDIPDPAVVRGLRTVRWPGRMEVVHQNPTVVLDGAHNPAAARCLADDMIELVPERPHRRLLYGTYADKDVPQVLEALASAFSSIHLCSPASPRALDLPTLRSMAQEVFPDVAEYDSVADGVRAWESCAACEDVLLVTGSLSVVGEARREFLA